MRNWKSAGTEEIIRKSYCAFIQACCSWVKARPQSQSYLWFLWHSPNKKIAFFPGREASPPKVTSTLLPFLLPTLVYCQIAPQFATAQLYSWTKRGTGESQEHNTMTYWTFRTLRTVRSIAYRANLLGQEAFLCRTEKRISNKERRIIWFQLNNNFFN